jgi:hypothetical protein
MIVYNITIKINEEIEKEWLAWQKQEHVPEIMASGQFTDYKFYRLLEPDDDNDITYVIQYFSPSLENYQHYIDNTAPLLRQKAFEKWGDKFVAFRTLMKVVN